MIRSTTRHLLSVHRRRPAILGSAPVNVDAQSSRGVAPNNTNHALISMRSMSDSTGGGGGWSWSKIIPGFGSKPIPPEVDAPKTLSDSETTSDVLAEQAAAFEEPRSSASLDGKIVDDHFPSVDESMAKIYGSDPTAPDSSSAIDPVIAAAEQMVAFEPTWWPSDQVLVLLNWVNESTAIPSYGFAIFATTLSFRILTAPLFVKGQRNSSRMAHIQPELAVIKEQVEKMGNRVDQETQMKIQAKTKALFVKYDCNPLASLLAPLTTMPFFLSMFFALRRAPDIFPDMLATGGMLWFPDLTLADPYCIMPLWSAATFLAMTEVGKEQMMATDPSRGRLMVNVFRGLAVIMVPITMHFNSAVFVYWTTNNTWSFLQALTLKQPAVRRYFGIWDPPKPVPGQETKGLIDEVKGLLEKKKEEQVNALAVDRVKAHNEIIEQQKMVKKKLMEKEGLTLKGTRKK